MNESVINISVVVPVYNVEKHLVRCLDSIFNQQFTGTYEVTAVDDASTDNSLPILKKYQAKESRLKIIEHEVNKKLTKTRDSGMKVATGDYILHVDSDDWLLPDTFENLHKNCIETNADVVVFNYARETSRGERTFVNGINELLVTTDKIKVQHLFFGATWTKIVKKALTDNMIARDAETNNTEDLIYSTEVLLRAEKVSLLPDSCYVYFENTESLTWQGITKKDIQNQVLIMNQIQRLISKYEPDAQFTNMLLNYYEKWIYLEFAKMHFWNTRNIEECIEFMKKMTHFTVMTESRIRKLESSVNNRFRCLSEVALRFGLLTSVRILLRCFMLKMNIPFKQSRG